jgi:hypothetical protein
MESAATLLTAVEERIAHACRLARREREEVTLVAIGKTHPAEAIAPLIEAGQRVFGENRVQEAQAKWPALRGVMPPSAITGISACAASRRNREGPSALASGCERVGKAGDSSTASARARLARPISPRECAVARVSRSRVG